MSKYRITVNENPIDGPIFRIETKTNTGHTFYLQCSSFQGTKNSWAYWLHRWRTASKEDRLLIAALIIYILDTCPDFVATFPGGLNEQTK